MAAEWFAKAFGNHYRLLYGHRDLAEARRCLDLLPTLAPLVSAEEPSRPVLDLGCGDGRHLGFLHEMGVSALGLDLSDDLLRAAGEQSTAAQDLRLIRGDMRTLPLVGESLAAVLSLFTAFGYFGSRAANLIPLREIARVLAPGGHWFLDFFDTAKVRAELGDGTPRVRERRLGPLDIKETRALSDDGLEVVKDVHLQPAPGQDQEAGLWNIHPEGLDYSERVSLMGIEQLDNMAASCGLTRVAAAGDYDGRPLHAGSRWILVYQKNGEGSIS